MTVVNIIVQLPVSNNIADLPGLVPDALRATEKTVSFNTR